MSKRSVYILLLDGRKDEDPEYWLNLIKSFGGNSPVLVVMNKVDTNPSFDVDRRFLQKKYPFIAGFHRTVCLGKISGVKELKDDLIATLDKVEILLTLWRKDWLNVKQEIENIHADFLSQQGYDALCAKHNIINNEDKEVLADFLNDLGAVVHFKDIRLNNLHILQPQWASRAAYKVISSKLVADNLGTLKTEWMSEIMRKEDENDFTYKRAIFPYILDLMQKFELCYPVRDGKEYLVPELMSIQQPELPKLEGPVLHFYFEYENILPRSILPRFIVRMHEDILPGMHWRTGVVLSPAMYDSIAVVICDAKARKINIEVSGQNRREHFYLIRQIFHSLHSSFEQLAVAEYIPLPDVEMAIEYDELVGYENNDIRDYFVGKLGKKYRVTDLLNGVEIPSVRQDTFQWDAFLCHSSADKTIIRRIARKMKKLEIKYWLDEEQILPGDNIIDKIPSLFRMFRRASGIHNKTPFCKRNSRNRS